MAATRTVIVSLGDPFDTGEECPFCGFDAVIAVLVLVDSKMPTFRYYCGRKCGQIREES